MNKYEYKGKSLDRYIAVELIIEIFQGKQHVQRKDIVNKISQRHRDRGGLPAKNDWEITLALDALKRLQFADNPTRGHWNILSIDEIVERVEYFRTIVQATKFRK